jgi:hypothetical protein
VRSDFVLELAVFLDPLEVALLLVLRARARCSGYAVLRPALLVAALLSVNFPASGCASVVRDKYPYVGHCSPQAECSSQLAQLYA